MTPSLCKLVVGQIEALEARNRTLMERNEHLEAVVKAALSYPYIPQGMVQKLETMMKKETKK